MDKTIHSELAMSQALKRITCSLVLCCSTYGTISHATSAQSLEQQANTSINELYHTLNALPKRSMVERIDWFSMHFIDTVYVLGSLGEGPEARYDQFPRYRVDGFDCDTYVNTVLALALADSAQSFQQCMKFNRYKSGVIAYTQRNHFTSIDWNHNNQKRGVLKDVTLEILDKNHKPVARLSDTLISKPGWYAHKSGDAIRLSNTEGAKKEQRLSELKSKGRSLETTNSKLPYVPLTALFPDNKPNEFILSQIPNGSIIEIVRPNWELRQQIGTNMDISHLGFAIWKDKILYFRQASSHYGKVVDVPMIAYLHDTLSSPTIKGIHIEVVVPQHPIDGDCAQF